MDEKERQRLLLKAAELQLKAEKLEKQINWNNDAERDSSLKKLENFVFESIWAFQSTQYPKD